MAAATEISDEDAAVLQFPKGKKKKTKFHILLMFLSFLVLGSIILSQKELLNYHSCLLLG
jgi:hypothetical protein